MNLIQINFTIVEQKVTQFILFIKQLHFKHQSFISLFLHQLKNNTCSIVQGNWEGMFSVTTVSPEVQSITSEWLTYDNEEGWQMGRMNIVLFTFRTDKIMTIRNWHWRTKGTILKRKNIVDCKIKQKHQTELIRYWAMLSACVNQMAQKNWLFTFLIWHCSRHMCYMSCKMTKVCHFYILKWVSS